MSCQKAAQVVHEHHLQWSSIRSVTVFWYLEIQCIGQHKSTCYTSILEQSHVTEATTALHCVIVMLLSIKGSCLIFSFHWQHFVFRFYGHDTLKHFQTLQAKQVKRKVQSTRPARETKDFIKPLRLLVSIVQSEYEFMMLLIAIKMST